MKKITALIALITLLTFNTAVSAEESWWNSLLNSIGLGEETVEEKEALPSIEGMLDSITSNLGVSQEQAQGGMASVLSFVKDNASKEQFAALAEYVPGIDSVMAYLPEVPKVDSSDALGGLVAKAAEMSESVAQLNDLKQRFDGLGLDTSMIKQYIEQAREYLDTPAGQEAKKLFSENLFKI